MFMLCRVCAQFRDARGKEIFTVDRGMLNQFMEVPDAIRQDPLFAMLLADGSIKTNVSPAEQKTLESDPMADAEPDGKQKTVKAKSAKPKAEAKANEEANMKDGGETAPPER